MEYSTIDIDLYQMTMLYGYFCNNEHMLRGAMEASTRKLPKNRSFLVVSGTRRISHFLATAKFTEEHIKIVHELLPMTKDDKEFTDYLLSIDFSKEIKMFGMCEGEIAFAQEPVLRLEGPIGLIQYVEKRILGILNHDIRIASKAARITIAANGKPVYEAGGRRAHEECTADTARACYIAGFEGTSSVVAYAKYGIKCVGTMGHVWIMSHKTEEQAFKNWDKVYPESTTYIIDTYHPRTGTENAIKITKKGSLGGIRLDSGDLYDQSTTFRRLLNNADDYSSKITASNDLNEYKISDLIRRGACIDTFLVGTEVVSTPDSPTCGFIFKLVAIDEESGTRNTCKKAATDTKESKATFPGRKQVYRHYVMYNKQTVYTHDTITLDVDKQSDPLSRKLIIEYDIRKDNGLADAKMARLHFMSIICCLPEHLRLITENKQVIDYPVEISNILLEEQKKINESSHV